MSGYWYLATPYSKHPDGIYAAHRLACREAARFVCAGIPVYAPIAHTHPIAIIAGLDPFDHKIWLPADQPMMDAARGLIVCMAEGWEQSVGIKHEIDAFLAAHKQVIYYDPKDDEIPPLVRDLAKHPVVRSAKRTVSP